MRDVLARSWWMLAVVALEGLGGCTSTHDGLNNGSSETHFLLRCEDSCGDGLSCLCGVCSRPCTSDAVCTSLAAGATCATPEAAECGGGEEQQACELRCERDADCAVLSADHRCESEVCRAQAAGGGDSGGTLPADGPACVATGTVAEIAVTNIDKVDLLFMVDNSYSMKQEQESLQQQFPRLIEILASGDRDLDGMNDFPPAKDLHLGVVSSDMGLVGIQDIEQCNGLGDDGILQHEPSPAINGCQASYPPFLTYTAGINQPAQTANDFACIAVLGTDGCGFAQPLESVLKALWPAVDPMPTPDGQNRITFLGDINMFGTLGHGDNDNAGFLRLNPAEGLSLISIIMVTDKEDCSSRDTSHFVPAHFLEPNDPLAAQPLNLRCFYNKQNLYPLERYITGYRALRPGNEDLVIFSAIVGVPPDLVEPVDYANVDWQDDAERNAFYDQILADPRMLEVEDPTLTPEEARHLTPSCNTPRGVAYPPIRILEVARGFGQNGSVHSICQDDQSSVIDPIIEIIAKQLGAVCLPRPLVRQPAGLVGCDVVWELPPPGQNVPTTPTECRAPDYPFLLPPDSGGATMNDRGGQVCKVAQLAVENGTFQPTVIDGQTFNEGWYYDDFSEAVQEECTGTIKQRVSFTPAAKPPTGVTVKLQCLSVTYPDPMDGSDIEPLCSAGPESATSARVGDACLPDAVPSDGFADQEVYLGAGDAECGGGVCMVFRLRGDPREDCVPVRPNPDNGDPGTVCATASAVEERIYCSCRCNAPAGYAECDCPDGFSCVDVLEQGGDDIRGGYCARNGTFTSR